MVHKVTALVLVSAFLIMAACNTVRGAASDVDSAANCTQNAIHGSRC
jgi:predicted small secreted protein